MEMHLIWAENNTHTIGDHGGIPWHLPEDLQHFRNLTTGKTVIMGAKTWASLPKKPLPNRHNIVLSRHQHHLDGATVAHNLEAALHLADTETWIIGGAQIYNLAMPQATHLHLTNIDDNFNGTVKAPHIQPANWSTINETPWLTGANGLRYRHHNLQRTPLAPIYAPER